MRFDVELEEDSDDISTPVEELCFSQDPGGVPKFEPAIARKVYAKEEVTDEESLGPLAAVLDNECDSTVPDCELEGKTWSMPITENVAVNKIEEWDVINLSGKYLFSILPKYIPICFAYHSPPNFLQQPTAILSIFIRLSLRL
jgi:hypothetical protein